MDVVLVMFKGTERREFPLEAERTVVGRRQDCDLRIPTRDVSRQHCEVVRRANAVTVKDLGSSNGTFVNGKRIAEVQLKPGDRLRIGPVTFFVQIDGQPAEIRPEEAVTTAGVTPTSAAPADEETFDLSDADLDADDALSALDELDKDDKKRKS